MRKIAGRIWGWSQDRGKKWGVNPVVLVALYIALYVWLPLAPFLPIPWKAKGVVVVILYVAPFVYGGLGILWRLVCRHRNPSSSLQIEKLDEELFRKFFDTFTHWVRLFWGVEPWGEYLRCSFCGAGASMYSSKGAISLERAQKDKLSIGDCCPTCGETLQLYWSNEAIQKYFAEMMIAPDYVGFVAFVSGEFAGWCIGYQKNWQDKPVFYVDTIAIVPKFRLAVWRYRLMRRFTLHLMIPTLRRGYKGMLFRTHLKAPWVADIATVYGFRFTGVISDEDPDRGYWWAPLTVTTIARALLVITAAGVFQPLARKIDRWLRSRRRLVT